MILAIETAAEVCSAALVHQQEVIASRSLNEKNVHSEKLMTLIEQVLKARHHSLKDVQAIAVSIGPGSFTGLRIGLSTAKGLCLALNTPLLAVPTLDGLAEEYRTTRTATHEEIFCSMIDAKREESFYAFFQVTRDDIHPLTSYSITAKKEILSQVELRKAVTAQPQCNAASIGALAERRWETMLVADFSNLEPLYLRDFVATTPKK